MKLLPLKILLLPFSLLYGLLMEIRNLLYDWGLFKQEKFPVAVISVGNLSAGGTGKTPFTLYLIRLLKARFKNIAVISRGYGRTSKGPLIIADREKVYESVDNSGDESWLIARKERNVVIAVSEKRSEGIRLVLENYPIDCIILDDAYQHRAVRRDLNILLINTQEPWRFNLPIPSGTLREFKRQKNRADLVVFSNVKSKDMVATGLLAARPGFRDPLFSISSSLNSVVDIDFNKISEIDEFAGRNCTAFAGIAHPENFKHSLEQKGITLQLFAEFKDHYHYQYEDIIALLKQAEKRNAQAVFCTEKDLVKIQPIFESTDLGKRDFPPVYGVALDLVVHNEDLLQEKIFSTLSSLLPESHQH